MTVHIITYRIDGPTVCVCGHSFGTPAPFTMELPNAKVAHFLQRHPRSFAMGRIY